MFSVIQADRTYCVRCGGGKQKAGFYLRFKKARFLKRRFPKMSECLIVTYFNSILLCGIYLYLLSCWSVRIGMNTENPLNGFKFNKQNCWLHFYCPASLHVTVLFGVNIRTLKMTNLYRLRGRVVWDASVRI